jgi:ankyrin repeat protein
MEHNRRSSTVGQKQRRSIAGGKRGSVLDLMLDQKRKSETDRKPLIEQSIHKLAAAGMVDSLTKLVHSELHPDVNVLDERGMSALAYACRNGHPHIAKFLLDAGADVNSGGGYSGLRALHHACNVGHGDIVDLLLEHGADPNTVDDMGSCPLHYAGAGGKLPLLDLLISKRADVNVLNNQNSTPLMRAAANGQPSAIKRLLAAGADARSANKSGDTALHIACRGGHVACVQLLAAAAPQTANVHNISDYTPLHVAAGNKEQLVAMADVLRGLAPQ